MKLQAMTGLSGLQSSYYERILGMKPSNLKLFYPLWDASGHPQDHSVTRAHVTASVISGYDQPGIGDGHKGITLDGANDYITLPAAAKSAWPRAEGTIILWHDQHGDLHGDETLSRVLYLLLDANNYIIMQHETTASNVGLHFKRGGIAHSELWSQASDPEAPICFGGTWSETEDEIRYFKSGTKTETDTTIGTWPSVGVASLLTLGAQNDTPTAPWKGELMYLAVWNTPLTDAEMAIVMSLP